MKRIAVFLALLCFSSALMAAPKNAAIKTFIDSEVSQTTSIGPITLYSPSVDSDFQVCVYLEDSTHSGTVFTFVNWTDDNGSQSSGVSSPGAPSYSGSACFAIHAVSGSTVTLTTTDSSAQTYNVFVTGFGLE